MKPSMFVFHSCNYKINLFKIYGLSIIYMWREEGMNGIFCPPAFYFFFVIRHNFILISVVKCKINFCYRD